MPDGPGLNLPRLFVSHSSKDNDVTRGICDLIEPRAGKDDATFEILVDYERLETGQDWDRQLHEWMGCCNAALIVLTANAARSDWVLKEATILSQRKALEPGFPVFVARADDVTEKLLTDEKWNPLTLGRIQRVGADEPAGIASEVRAGLADLGATDTPFEAMVHVLSGLLRRIDTAQLATVAGKLDDYRPPPWSSAADDKERAVQAIARHLMAGSLGQYNEKGLEKLIGDLRWAPETETLRNILTALAPHWVDAVAAAPVGVQPTLRERRATAINGDYVAGSDSYTAAQYVHRAHLAEALTYKVWPVAGANAGDLAEHYTEEICNQARRRLRGLEPDDPPEKVIARLRRSRNATIYVVLPAVPPQDVVTTLLDRFPKLNFVLATGPELKDETELDRVDYLEPAIELDVEARWFDDWDYALMTIEQEVG